MIRCSVNLPLLKGMALVCLLSFSSPLLTDAQSDRKEAWIRDLRFLVEEIPARHPDPWNQVDSTHFVRSAAKLEEILGDLQDHEIIVEMARLAALIGDAHTYVDLPENGRYGFGRLPVRLEWFSDGIFIAEATRDYEHLLGAKVLRIGERTVEDAWSDVSDVVSVDNLMTERFLVPRRLVIPEVLHALRIAPDFERVRLTVQSEKGTSVENLERIIPPGRSEWILGRPKGESVDTLFWSDPEKNYWFTYLEDRRAVYLQFNSVRVREDEPMEDFAARLAAFVRDNPVERLIVDVRRNIGGDWAITIPLVRQLVKTGRFEETPSLFVLIGRASISATVVFAQELARYTSTVFIGEPTGGAANQYGENRILQLPNSGLSVSYSTEFFQTGGPLPKERSRWITPALAVDVSAETFFGGTDPVLRAAIEYEPGPSIAELIEESFRTSGLGAAMQRYHDFKSDARYLFVDTERPIRHLADRLLEEGSDAAAFRIHAANVESYPTRAYPLLGLAFARKERGHFRAAREAFLRAIEVLPGDESLNRYNRRRLGSIAREALSTL